MRIQNLFLKPSYCGFRHFSKSKIQPPGVVRVTNHIAHLGRPKEGPKPRQLLSLPPFPGHPLPGKNSSSSHVTAISWLKYYFDDILGDVIRSHFNKGLVQMECLDSLVSPATEEMQKSLRKIKHNEVMEPGARIFVPVSVAETKISKRFDIIPSGTLYPNADEIEYLRRLVIYKDSSIILLNKPPKLPVQGNVPIHNSMDALAAAALSYDYDEGPKLATSYAMELYRRSQEDRVMAQMLEKEIARKGQIITSLQASSKGQVEESEALKKKVAFLEDKLAKLEVFEQERTMEVKKLKSLVHDRDLKVEELSSKVDQGERENFNLRGLLTEITSKLGSGL